MTAGEKLDLERCLEKQDKSKFDEYASLKKSLEPVHEEVTTGATVADGGLLTDHGPDHVARVIVVASDLVSQLNVRLSPYEIFSLLTAIQVHDIGNLLGRKDHEKRSREIWGFVAQMPR